MIDFAEARKPLILKGVRQVDQLIGPAPGRRQV